MKNSELSSSVTASKKEVDTFHCTPNSNVAVINGKTLRIYECGKGDKSFVLATEGHPQPHLDVTLDREAVNSLSDVYIKRTVPRPVHRQKRQFGGFGSGGGFSGANANAGALSGGGGFGGLPFSSYPLGGGGGFSQAGSSAQAGSFGGGFGGFGR